MGGFIATSSALFEATTGFSFDDLIDWAGDQLIIILGMGLGLVNALLPWILALVVIGVIIRLIYHGLRWLHILR